MDEASAKYQFRTADRAERKKLLAAWVAELNASTHDAASEAFDRWLTRMIDEFDEQEKGSIDPEDLRKRYDTWLKTADDPGGDESARDPTAVNQR